MKTTDRIRRRLTTMLRGLGSLLPRPDTDPRTGRVIRPWRDDAQHGYPTVGLTPSRALAFIQQADAGTPQMQFELFTEMLQKWPRLAAVESTRRLALTGLDWEINPQPGRGPAARRAPTPNGGPRPDRRPDTTPHPGRDFDPNPARQGNPDRAPNARTDARRVADFCRDTLERIDTFRDVLDHMAAAIGFGISAAELVWEDGRLIDLVPVPHSRLVSDPHEPWRLRVRTEDNAAPGVALDEHPDKWLVHAPRAQPGRHFEGGLLRASVLLYVAQNLSFKDWLIYSQIAGMPLRVGRFEPGTPEAEKRELLKMLQALGTDAVAIFNKSVELEMVDASRATGERPYRPLQEYCNNEVTILWLGQHLTTDIRGQGSRAAAEIHDRVREDLLVDDIADEAATIRRDLLRPVVQARFGAAAPVPVFRRALVESVDTRVLADTLSVAVNELGLPVPARWVHRALGIPEPTSDERVLRAGPANARQTGAGG